MATIVTRAGKGSPLTNSEVDANFNNLNSDKLETGGGILSGVLQVTAGTVSAPGLTISGDTDTGLFSPAANALAVATSGAERMRVDSSGDVGIGAVPTGLARLMVTSPANSPSLWLTDATQSTLTIKHESGNLLTYDVGGSAVQRWVGNSSERMRIDASGNVGIGTSSPGLYAKLTVLGGSIYTDAALYSNDGTTVARVIASGGASYWGNTTNHPAIFQTNNIERMRIDASGNVGIGTSSPGVRFHVNSGAADEVARFEGTGSPFITLFDTNVRQFYLNAVANSVDMVVEPSKALTFGTNGSERMRIDASGNVGIGTSSPNVKLEVDGIIRGRAVGGEGGQIELNNPGNASIGSYFDVVATNNTRWYSVENNSIHEIGQLAGTGGIIKLYTAGSERARITADGEVYIAGTTDQGAYNLQVNGTGVWGAGAYVNGSDARIKDDIAPLASGLDVVAKLKPVQFRYKESWSKDTSLQPGFIAQDLQAALADQPYVDGVVLQGPEYMSVAYQSLIPLLTKAIQELKAENDALKARVAALENK